MPDDLTGAPDDLVDAPEYLAGAPEYLAGAPEYLAGAPEHLAGAPERTRMPVRGALGVIAVFLGLIVLSGCDREPASVGEDVEPSSPAVSTEGASVRVGAEVLAAGDFAELQGKRVGLIVNHTARVDTAHLADLMHGASGVEITALFGPEHGIRGSADAGEKIDDGRDTATGAPIFSLYGSTRKPTPEMLRDVDALVYDIQDVGARFYTYISTLGLAMQAAAEQDIPIYVLDRPNPLGGDYVSGFMLEDEHESFVGQYRIPAIYGMTIGELAQMIRGEALMEGLGDVDLHVIRMEGWDRSMLWPVTGLPWIAPSPNIPDFETALVYAGTVLFEAVSASEGRGTRTPFTLLGAPWADGEVLADTLNGRQLAGLRFEAASFTPESIEGMASSPKLLGESLEGIRISVTEPDSVQAVEAGIHILHAFYHEAERQNESDFVNRPDALARLAGTDRLLEMLRDDASPEEIIDSWQTDVEAFKQQREAYLLY